MSAVQTQHPSHMADKIEEAKRNWPHEPYKGVNFYNAIDAPLFCERDDEIHLCGRLLTSPATKLLLLHGLSGTGKSSFIRAGLFARVINANPKLYVPVTDGEPCVIRSTADPIARLHESFAANLHDTKHFPGLSVELRARLQNQLSACSTEGVIERVRVLRQVLETIATKLVGTLLLIIDQAEEIFTLDPLRGRENQEAYFSFLEGLCFDRFDIKVLISLRTEYYGQFADNFRIAPSLKISTVVAGIEQFMLQAVNDVDRLVKAIKRPTSRDLVGGACIAPVWRYWFDFVPNLPERIATEVVKHSKESSAWPVMQIVCAGLFERLPPLNDPPEIRFIEDQLYDAVDEAIDRFIESAIKTALEKTGITTPKQRLVDGWKHIVSSLVARQQGSTLTSLLLGEKELQEKALEAGIRSPIGLCLSLLAQEKPRLLRSATSHEATTGVIVTRYSLGHDALAPSLFRWQETRGKEIADRRREWQRAASRFLRSAVAAALVFFVGLVAAVWIAISSERLALHAALKTVMAEPRVGGSLLMLAALERNAPEPWRWFHAQTIEDVDEHLRGLLMAAPLVSESMFSAAVSADGARLALVYRDGWVVMRSLSDLRVAGRRLYQVPVPSQAIERFAVGFLDGLDRPVVVSGDSVYIGSGNATQISAITGDKVNEYTSASFLGGVLRLSTYGGSQATIVRFAGSTRFKLAESLAAREYRGPQNFPVYSPFSPLLADTDGDTTKAAGSNEGVELTVRGENGPITYQKRIPKRSPLRPEADRLLPWSMAFLPDDQTLVIRDALEDFTFVEGISRQNSIQLTTLTVSAQERARVELEPLRNLLTPWGGGVLRPPLAAVRKNQGYEVAWLTEHGLSIMESDHHGSLNSLLGPRERSNALTSGPLAPNSFSTIQFDSTGSLLILISTGTDSKTFVNVWDVSDQNYMRIKDMDWRALVDEACRIAGGYGFLNPGRVVSAPDFEKLPVHSQIQPCS